MTVDKEAILKMDKAIICLGVELPEAVWKDVNNIWQQAKSSLRKENEELKKLLHDLTPGGSEFYNDPKYCVEWIKQSRLDNHYALAKQIQSLKIELTTLQSSNEAKEKECEYWKQRCEAAEDCASYETYDNNNPINLYAEYKLAQEKWQAFKNKTQ